ncbi:MAG: hypothetical protein PHI98_08700 [Eubacteriales bacterium]|nr:hypothetical protein [Eubacteriales bacterium]
MDMLIVIIVLVYAFSAVFKKYGAPTKQQAAGKQTSHKTATARSSKPTSRPQPTSTEGMSREYKPMQTHMQQLIAEQEKERNTTYVGSLGGTSTEGVDLCDPTLGHAPNRLFSEAELAQVPSEEAEPFDRQAVINGVIMSEILKRPYGRQWRRT